MPINSAGDPLAYSCLDWSALRLFTVILVLRILAGLSIIQGILSMVEGFRFLGFVRRSMRETSGTVAGRVSVIAPCKGAETGLSENLEALFDQDYPDYELIFAIGSHDDSARGIIEGLIGERPERAARQVIAPPADGRSEKVNNLLCALDQVSSDSDTLVFVDSDARVRPDWLGSLVAPLADARVGVATGYRWYLPRKSGFWSALLSSWNGTVATTLGDHGRNFAWGGSTAILRKTFERIGVRERWTNAVSDDYPLTRAVKEAGLSIRFVPRCLVLSRQDASPAELFEFTTRQLIITRVYDSERWWTGMISYLLFDVVFFGGLAVSSAQGIGVLGPVLGVIYSLGSIKGVTRLMAAREAIPEARGEIDRLWWMYCLCWPLVALLFLFNFSRSAATRRITWRGVSYEMRSPDETIVIRSPTLGNF